MSVPIDQIARVANDATARACGSFLPVTFPRWDDQADGNRDRTVRLVCFILEHPGITVEKLQQHDEVGQTPRGDPHYAELMVVWEAFIGIVESMR